MGGLTSTKGIFFLAIPLGIAAFIHLLNPIGFPDIHVDEGTYMDRIMRVLEGEGPKEPLHYDHPYFGQLAVAATLQLMGYPDSLQPVAGNLSSTEMLILVPRFVMGILFVIDTFLIYRIAQHRYNNKIAFLASIMFAVAPMASTLTRVLLDNILLPFLLSSLLFAVTSSNLNISKKGRNIDANVEKNIIILISGIFLGLAIFAKIPAFSFIPVVAFLIYTNSGQDLRRLGLWFIPVVLIPAIWPIHSMMMGQYDLWLNGAFWQAGGREASPLSWDSFNTLFKLDPILFVLGLVGVLYAAVKRDYFILLGTIPFVAFLYFIGYVKVYFFAPWVPMLSIAFALFVIELASKISSKSNAYQKILPISIISAIVIFQLATVTNFLGVNANESYFRIATFVSEHVPNNNSNDRNKIAVIGSPIYLWIPKYVFEKDKNDYIHFNSKQEPETHSFLLVVDSGFKNTFSAENNSVERNEMLYNHSKTIGLFDDNTHHSGRTEIRTNYLNPLLTTVVSSQ
jgi:hypothetical protein